MRWPIASAAVITIILCEMMNRISKAPGEWPRRKTSRFTSAW